ncbi:hypothetical protein GCM10009069_17150 [Algimonas arctica]|uniref:Uncharacterized protein n=1 Tax=Algimonas arctica TaxID=1479486 RepID=A0A8J3CQF2_9PROT|nr:hypothetical protein [Algimonas arctica]GHA94740.1 hypothetical protein GCM10009069_17150 [Algimonas arctica]
MGQPGTTKRHRLRHVGRADQLRPASTLTSSGVALILATVLGAGITTEFNIEDGLLNLTILVAWVSVALSVFRLLACSA